MSISDWFKYIVRYATALTLLLGASLVFVAKNTPPLERLHEPVLSSVFFLL